MVWLAATGKDAITGRSILPDKLQTDAAIGASDEKLIGSIVHSISFWGSTDGP